MIRTGISILSSLFLMTGAAMADTAPTLSPSSSGIIALNSLPNPSTTLATAPVADAKGTVVGAVQKIVLDASGKPATVDVALLGSNAVVAMDASQFNYDQGHNVLDAQLDAQRIAQEPRAPG
jgi:hypothetical protein